MAVKVPVIQIYPFIFFGLLFIYLLSSSEIKQEASEKLKGVFPLSLQHGPGGRLHGSALQHPQADAVRGQSLGNVQSPQNKDLLAFTCYGPSHKLTCIRARGQSEHKRRQSS